MNDENEKNSARVIAPDVAPDHGALPRSPQPGGSLRLAWEAGFRLCRSGDNILNGVNCLGQAGGIGLGLVPVIFAGLTLVLILFIVANKRIQRPGASNVRHHTKVLAVHRCPLKGIAVANGSGQVCPQLTVTPRFALLSRECREQHVDLNLFSLGADVTRRDWRCSVILRDLGGEWGFIDAEPNIRSIDDRYTGVTFSHQSNRKQRAGVSLRGRSESDLKISAQVNGERFMRGVGLAFLLSERFRGVNGGNGGEEGERPIGIVWRPWIRLVFGSLFLSLGLLLAYRSEFGGYRIDGLAYLLIVIGLTGLFWTSLWNGAAPRWLWSL